MATATTERPTTQPPKASSATSPERAGKQAQWQTLLGHILGYQATWITEIGLKAGLFRAVAAHAGAGLTEADLAAHLGHHPRYVAVWCRAAFAYGLLDWDAATGYRLAPHLDALLLDPDDPLYLGGRFPFYAALHEDFRAFPAHLESGAHWPRHEHDPWLQEAIANLTKPDAAMITDAVLPHLPALEDRLESGGTILDVGCGGGHHLVHYARRFPCATVVGLEVDPVAIALARRTTAEAGLAERIEIRSLDANRLEVTDAYDLVTLSLALHETGGPAEYRNVLARVRRALAPGGAVVVSELPYPDAPTAYRQQTAYKLLAGIQFHEALVGCGAITQGELAALLGEAGFADPRPVEQPIPTRFVMVAER